MHDVKPDKVDEYVDLVGQWLDERRQRATFGRSFLVLVIP
jgi:hypothetical protein